MQERKCLWRWAQLYVNSNSCCYIAIPIFIQHISDYTVYYISSSFPHMATLVFVVYTLISYYIFICLYYHFWFIEYLNFFITLEVTSLLSILTSLAVGSDVQKVGWGVGRWRCGESWYPPTICIGGHSIKKSSIESQLWVTQIKDWAPGMQRNKVMALEITNHLDANECWCTFTIPGSTRHTVQQLTN